VPVRNVIEIFASKKLTEKQRDYLATTDFDYVIASSEATDFGKPLLIVEFGRRTLFQW
jgi:hypothetical protein